MLLINTLISLVVVGIASSTSPTLAPSSIRSSLNKISLLGGLSTASSSGTGGPATSAAMNAPLGIWSDTAGYIFFVESGAFCVRKFAVSNNIVAKVAGVCGGSSTYNADNIPATAATMNPWYVHGDSVGTIYVNDYSNQRVRKVVSNVITTFAGTGTKASTGDGGPATSAQLYDPTSVFFDTSNRLYISAYDGYVVRSVSAGIISSAVGTGTSGFSGMGGAATSAEISTLEGLFFDTASNLYITDSGNAMVFTVSGGVISKVLGTGTSGYSGENVPVTSTSVVYPIGITLDSSNGDMYIGTHTGRRVMVTTKTTGLMSTFAGNGVAASSGDGGYATAASINAPCGLMLPGDGSMYIAEYFGHNLRLVYSVMPTTAPSAVPSLLPSVVPTVAPSVAPSMVPTVSPTVLPTLLLTVLPTVSPTTPPSQLPTVIPTIAPSVLPTVLPTALPTLIPSLAPTVAPSVAPTMPPTLLPTILPFCTPTVAPTLKPSVIPSRTPSATPTFTFVPISNSPNFKIANAYAYAGLTNAGAVKTWGKSDAGGDSSSVSGSLTSEVIEVVASKSAFAALKSDGSVIAWGRAAEISGWSAYSSASAGVVSLVGSEQAFAGVTSAGGVIAFGADCCGGNVDQNGWAVRT